MLDKEYRVDVKVRNNIILYKIEQAGYKTVGEFCRLNNIMKYVSSLGNIINMKKSPLTSEGDFRTVINDIAEILGCAPWDLFTDTQMHTVLENNKRSYQVQEAEMKFMLGKGEEQKLLEDMILEKQKNDSVDAVINTLTPREQKVLKRRFGLDGHSVKTLQEIGKEFGVTGQRIRDIESKALRKLRHPTRADRLRDFMEEIA